eukprot:TRINITY_DN43544_c0_g1_i1.p3 TRINITY_DN43544_c0_g1~~TRINITY_DN43544_c0_g1_i1.p3  ORF type:complete len:179 (+),score=61.75 TRINITY_DN43544_c0_g1_i1:59-595(+)
MDARKVKGALGGVIEVKVFTADNLEKHLADGWTPEQLSSGKVAVLGAKIHVVRLERTSVKGLKDKLEDAYGYSKECCTLMRGKTVVLDSEPVFHGTTFLMMKPRKEESKETGGKVPMGSLRLRDPNQYGGSRTMVVAEGEEKAADKPPPPEPQVKIPTGRPVNRNEVLAALRRRHGPL